MADCLLSWSTRSFCLSFCRKQNVRLLPMKSLSLCLVQGRSLAARNTFQMVSVSRSWCPAGHLSWTSWCQVTRLVALLYFIFSTWHSQNILLSPVSPAQPARAESAVMPTSPPDYRTYNRIKQKHFLLSTNLYRPASQEVHLKIVKQYLKFLMHERICSGFSILY